ncbi:MAG: ABC transporter ATP-binding protein [bacterium]
MIEKKHTKLSLEMILQVWKHWKPTFKKSKWSLLGAMVFFSASMILEVLIKPLCWREVFDGLVAKIDVLPYFYLALATSIAAFIMSRFGDASIVLAETRIIRNLKHYIMEGLLGKSMQFYTDHSSGGLVAKSKRFAAVSEQVIDECILSIIRSMILIVYFFIFVAITIPSLIPVFLIWITVFISLVVFITKRRLKYDLMSANADSITTGFVSDTFMSVFTLRIFSSVFRQLNVFQEIITEEERKRRKSWYIGNLQWGLQSVLVILLEFICMYYVLKEIHNGVYKVGMAALVQSYIASLGMYMWGLGRSLVKVHTAFTDAYEMAELLDHESTEPINRGDVFIPQHYGIELKKVSFGYDAEQPILRNFSFSFEPGRSYGVIGKTGSGKSTLMKLVMKFYNADKGIITVGSRDIESIHKNTLRSFISFVSQIPTFPSITIREVIALGNPSATEQEIISAAKQACCDFIWEKPLGFDTVIGERGIKLSGGEAQRLAIAAAILKDAPIIVMDEPTSALDAVTERAIQNALNTSFKGKTMIVIAHRLSTVAVLDEIILLEHGEIVDHGSHNKLLVSSQAYSEAWELQTNPQIFVHE